MIRRECINCKSVYELKVISFGESNNDEFLFFEYCPICGWEQSSPVEKGDNIGKGQRCIFCGSFTREEDGICKTCKWKIEIDMEDEN